MTLLDGFKVIPLTEKIEDSYLTISARSLKFNRATARILGQPKTVHILSNEKRMQIAIVPAKKNDEDSVDFTFEEEGREKPIYVKEPMIMKGIKCLAVLKRDGVNLTLTIKGTAYPDEKVIIYDLNEAEEAVMKPRGRKKREK